MTYLEVSRYGNDCPLLDDRRNRPLPHRRRGVSRREIWASAGKVARRHSHRRGERFVLFPDHEFDLCVCGVDDRVECDSQIVEKVTHGKAW